MATTKADVMSTPDDRLKIPILGFVASAVVAIAFATGALDALISNHFKSWNSLTLRPEGGLARAIEGLLPTMRVIAMVGAAAFGYTSLRRLTQDNFKPGIIRLCIVAFSPIVVEILDFGTQDGQVPDLDKLPIHSMVLLALVVIGPALVALWDARVINDANRAHRSVAA